jgi:hypothetical protein
MMASRAVAETILIEDKWKRKNGQDQLALRNSGSAY